MPEMNLRPLCSPPCVRHYVRPRAQLRCASGRSWALAKMAKRLSEEPWAASPGRADMGLRFGR